MLAMVAVASAAGSASLRSLPRVFMLVRPSRMCASQRSRPVAIAARASGSLSVAVYDTSDRYLGCCYLYPMGRRTQLTEELLKYDVDVSWWVTPPAYEEGYYTKLYRALGHWLVEELPFKEPYYSNREIPAD